MSTTRPVLLGSVLLAALAALLLGPAPAYAEDNVPAGNATFERAGSPVYPTYAVGLGCRLFGSCAGAADQLTDRATPRYLSTRPGEVVAAECTTAGVVRVRGFFAGGDDTVSGWALSRDLTARGAVPSC